MIIEVNLNNVFYWYGSASAIMFLIVTSMQFSRPFKRPVMTFFWSILLSPVALPFVVLCFFFYLLKGVHENIKPVKYQKTVLNRKNRRTLKSSKNKRF